MSFSSDKKVEVAAALLWEGDTLPEETEASASCIGRLCTGRRFLICRRPMHKARGGLYEFVGGKREEGETLPETLRRECMEELAVSVEVGERFGETVYKYPDLTVRLTLFHCRIRDGVPRLLEHSELHWILPSEIPRYEFCPADEVFLSEIRRKYGGACVFTER